LRLFTLPIFISKSKLRVALNKYNQLIREYPTSDKIDDAAFKAGRIYEFFDDYEIALLYYKRTYQWNENTFNPARYRAARILDYKLGDRNEALKLYRESLDKESENNPQYTEAIEQRITERTLLQPGKIE
jgi:tetratricopeptide (TPR) repeat protein